MDKRKRMVANEQAFQSIYLDPSTDKWNERIVFHDPIFDDEMPGVIALKSLELEDLIGIVVAAPRNVLRNYRQQVKEYDLTEKWGKEQPATIIAKLVKLAKELGAVISYEQLGQEVTKQRDVEEELKESKEAGMFFDPATQRQIVKKGPHYFDPSLPTIEDVEDLQTKRQAKGRSQAVSKPVNPGIGAYPKDITDAGKGVWDKLMSDHQVKIFKYAAPKRRWEFAEYLYDLACTQKGIPSYALKPEKMPSEVLKKLKSSNDQTKDLLETVMFTIRKQGLLQNTKPGKEKVRDIRKMNDDYVLTTVKGLPMEGLGTVQQIIKHLTDNHNFIGLDDTHCYKQVNLTTQVSFSLNTKNLRKVNIYNIFRIPEKDAIMVSKSKDQTQIVHRLTKLLDMWLKSGRFA